MRSRDGTRSVGVVAAQVLATCTNQSRGRALGTEYYVSRYAHKILIRTWSFVLKQRGLGHEGEGVRGNAFFLYPTAVWRTRTTPCMSSARYDPGCCSSRRSHDDRMIHRSPALTTEMFSAASASVSTESFTSHKKSALWPVIHTNDAKNREIHTRVHIFTF
jgi:hypothetical protein